MKTIDFLREFDEDQFPMEFGPWISFVEHDPPFNKSTLNQMEKQGIIEINKNTGLYRLTRKATKINFGL